MGTAPRSLRPQEGPGFAVGVVEAGLGIVAATEEKAGAAEKSFERDDVPGVLGDDVGGEEVDFAGEIGDGAASSAAVGVEVVQAFVELRGTLYLHAPDGWQGLGRAPAESPGWGAEAFQGWAIQRGFREGSARCASRDGRGGRRHMSISYVSLFYMIRLRRGSFRMIRCAQRVAGGLATATECLKKRAVGMAAAAGVELASVDDGVVAFAVTEGLGDSESEAGGFESEGEFGELSATLGGEFALAGGVDGGLGGIRMPGARSRMLPDGLLRSRLLPDRLWARR